MGPERGGETTEKALPLHLLVTSRLPFTEIPSQNALGLGKERSRRMRPPSLLLGPSSTPSPDAGMEKIWNWGVAEVIDEAMLLDFLLPGLALASIKTAHGRQT